MTLGYQNYTQKVTVFLMKVGLFWFYLTHCFHSSYSYIMFTVPLGVRVLQTHRWSARSMRMLALHLPSARLLHWFGAWDPRIFWKKFYLPQMLLPFMNWDQITLEAFRLYVCHVSNLLFILKVV